VLSVLNKMLKVAVRWKQIVEVPVRIELLSYQKKEMEFYSLDTYTRLVNAAQGLEPEDELLVRAGGDAGLRRGEIIGLTDKAINMERGVLIISTNVVRGEIGSTKGLKVREVPMSDGLRSLLARSFNGRHGHLLAQESGDPESEKMLRTRMAKIQTAAGIENKGSLHILRHTYCSHLAMGGVPVLEIQRLAGHAHLTTTMQYMHLAPNAGLQDAMNKLAAIRGKAVGGRNSPQLRVVEGGAATEDAAEADDPEIDQSEDAPDASTHR
jgi:integrase